jgi:hypothetical protein
VGLKDYSSYEQLGYIWQAEEWFDAATPPTPGSPVSPGSPVNPGNGKSRDPAGAWRRVYGFVGAHHVAEVPAEEIEFPAEEYNCRPWSNGWDAELTPPGMHRDGNRITMTMLGLDSPMVAKLTLRNRRGVAQELPATLISHEADGVRLLKGVKLSLSRMEFEGGGMTYYVGSGSDEGEPPKMDALALKPAGVLKPGGPPRRLEPGETCVAAELDLRDFFTITKPGNYSLKVIFETECDVATGVTADVQFGVAAPTK